MSPTADSLNKFFEGSDMAYICPQTSESTTCKSNKIMKTTIGNIAGRHTSEYVAPELSATRVVGYRKRCRCTPCQLFARHIGGFECQWRLYDRQYLVRPLYRGFRLGILTMITGVEKYGERLLPVLFIDVCALFSKITRQFANYYTPHATICSVHRIPRHRHP